MCPGSGTHGEQFFCTTPQLRITDQSLTIALTGALTRPSVPMIRLHLLTLAAAWGPTELLLDLSGVQAVDEEGAEPLLEAQRLQHERGAVLRLIATSAAVLHFFHTETRFARLLIPLTDPPAHDASRDRRPIAQAVELSDRRNGSRRSARRNSHGTSPVRAVRSPPAQQEPYEGAGEG